MITLTEQEQAISRRRHLEHEKEQAYGWEMETLPGQDSEAIRWRSVKETPQHWIDSLVDHLEACISVMLEESLETTDNQILEWMAE